MKPLTVEIWAFAFVPVPYKRDPSKLTKKRVQRKVKLGTGRVLYADRTIVLVRAFGETNIFHGFGAAMMSAMMWSYDDKHPKAELLGRSWQWHLLPDSLERLKTTRRKAA